MRKHFLLKTMLLLCALIVGSSSAWAQDTYTKVTSNSQIQVGSEIIFVCEGNDQAMTSNSGYPGTSVTITESTITLESNSEVCVMTVGGSANAYTFTYDGNKQLSWAKNSFSINQTTSSQNLWTVNSDGSFTCNVSGVTDSSTRKQVRHNLTTGNSATNKFGCYTSSTGKAVCLYVKENSSPLASIALSGDYPTSFEVGDEFSHEGMIITATYENGNTSNVTSKVTSFTGYDMNTTGTQTVIVSYTEKGVTKTATYDITVAEKQTKDFVKVTDANTLRAGDQFILVYEGGSLALGAINSGGKYYESASVTINEGVITDPTGVAVLTLGGEEDAWTIKSSLSGNYLSLTSSSNELKAAASVGDDKTEEWTISISDGNVYIINNKYPQSNDKDRYIQWNSGSPRFACYTGTQKDIQLYRLSKSVTITSAEYATYCGNKALNFDGVGIKAYTATDNGDKVKLNEITQVPANTPVVLYKAGGGTVDVPVIASADAIEGTNHLRVSEGAVYSNAYVLAMNPTIGFYLWDSSVTLNPGKIYLQAASGSRSFLGFEEGNTTGVADINRETITNNGSFYNLNGQRVAQPTKGLYIVNGRKFVVK